MFNDTSYKLSFIYAALIHVLIMMLLLMKYHNSSQQIAFKNVNIINAVVIGSEHDFDRQLPRPGRLPKVAESPPTPVPEVKPSSPPLSKETSVQKQNRAAALEQAAKMESEQLRMEKVKAEKKKLLKKREALRKVNAALQKRLLIEQQSELKSIKEKIQRQKQAKYAVNKQQLMDQMLSNQLASESQELAVARGQRVAGEVNKYKAALIQAIATQWIVPDGVKSGATCVLLVEIAPGGMVLNVKLLKSSGNDLLDRSAQKAVLKASPLPVPADSVLFDEFRSLKLTVRPEGII